MFTKPIIGAVLALASATQANAQSTNPDDPLLDRIFPYKPSTAGAIVCGIIYVLIGIVHSWSMIRHRSWWCWCLPVGAIGSGAGLILRAVFVMNSPDSLGLYSVGQFFVLCMPALFLAFNYMLFVRIIVHNVGAKHVWLKPTIIAKIFVGIDVFTFIIQGSSAPLMIKEDSASIGKTIFQIGIIAQSISYYTFCALVVWAHVSVKKREFGVTGHESWWIAFWCIYVSSVFIIIRSIYRIVEAVASKTSSVHTNEGFLYGLDVVPLILCTLPYIWKWPSPLLGVDAVRGLKPEDTPSTYRMVKPTNVYTA